MRNINYAPLRHPLAYKFNFDFDGALNNLGTSMFVPVIKERHVLLPIVFSPLVLVVEVLVTLLVSSSAFGDLAWWITFGKVMLVSVIIFFLITWLVVWGEGVDWDERERQQREEERRRLAAEVDALICTTTGSRRPNVWQLPFGPKTVRFYALALKQKVCKGFAA